MEGRKIFFVAMVALFALLAQHASAAVNPDVRLQNYSIDVQPAAPGSAFTLALQMYSLYPDVCAENLAVQLTTSYPLYVKGPDTQYIDLLCTSTPPQNAVLYFQVAVDPLATSGTYQVSVGSTYEKSFLKFTSANTVNVRVQGNASFEAAVDSSSPVDVYPGDQAALTVKFNNNGSGRADSVYATLSSQDPGVEVKSAGSTSLLGTVEPRSTSSVTFNVEAYKNYPAGDKKLDAKISFVNEDGSVRTQDFPLDFMVRPKAEFIASTGDQVVIGENQQVAIKLTNTGQQDAEKLKVSIVPIYPYSTDGTVRYVESLPAGQSAQVLFNIAADKEALPGAQNLKLSVDFEDPQGKKLSDTADFALTARTVSLWETIAGFWWLAAIVVIAGAVLYMRRMQGKRVIPQKK